MRIGFDKYWNQTIELVVKHERSSMCAYLARLLPWCFLLFAFVLAQSCSNGSSPAQDDSTELTASPQPLDTSTPPTDALKTVISGTPFRAAGIAYPDRSITPGDTLPVTAQQVCKPGYSSSVRSVSTSTKNKVYAEYQIASHPTGAYEVDHLISLELGGSNDIKNLWPEPADPRPGFHEKDTLENKLHSLVCAGKIDLSEAQREIATDWYAAYLILVLGQIATPVPASPTLPSTATSEPTALPLAPVSTPVLVPVPSPTPVAGGARTGAVCNDGTLSTATGSGACSHHGGVARWLYQ